jgi:hypothetical protein
MKGSETMKIFSRWNENFVLLEIEGADLREANLRGADLRGANLRGANLREANLRGANLREANLREANLRGADLRGANLREANLRGADLEGANLEGANLEGANLEGANLEGANLRGADLEGADLEGANLEGANLEGANLEGANLEAVILNWQSHQLLGELLKRAAGESIEKRMVAGLITISTDWCWHEFLAIEHSEFDIEPGLLSEFRDRYKEWAIQILAQYVQNEDGSPDIIKEYAQRSKT